MVYHVEYDGYYAMSWHDREENALKRWFDNYKIDRLAYFATDTEWLVVKELPSVTRRKKRFVCEIGDDGRGTKREVIMDHTAPPAPLLTFAAKRRFEPPPPKTPEELRKEAEYRRMMSLGYEPYRIARHPEFRPSLFYSTDSPIGPMKIQYDIGWRLSNRSSIFSTPVGYEPPPPPSHRRNV